MPIQNNEKINWDLAKLDWDMVLRYVAKRAETAQSGANAAMAANASIQNTNTQTQGSMSNALTAANTQMRGQDIEQGIAQRGQDVTSRGQDLNFAAAQMQNATAQRGQDLDYKGKIQSADIQTQGTMALAGYPGMRPKTDSGALPQQQKDLLNHQMDATMARDVLMGKNPQSAWSKYYNAMQVSGIDPEKMGLSPAANAQSMLYMGNVLQRSTQGIKSITGETGQTESANFAPQSKAGLQEDQQQNQLALQAQKNDNKLQQIGVQGNVEYLNKLREETNKMTSTMTDPAAIEQALKDVTYLGVGTGPGAGVLNNALAISGSALGSEDAKKAAAAGTIITQAGGLLALLQRGNLPGQMSDADRNWLVSLSINKNNTYDQNQAALHGLQALMERKQAQTSFFEKWMANNNGDLTGASDAFKQWMTSNPIYDPKEKKINSIDIESMNRYIKGAPVNNTSNQAIQQPQQAQLNIYAPQG